jgi:hypothetical protein
MQNAIRNYTSIEKQFLELEQAIGQEATAIKIACNLFLTCRYTASHRWSITDLRRVIPDRVEYGNTYPNLTKYVWLPRIVLYWCALRPTKTRADHAVWQELTQWGLNAADTAHGINFLRALLQLAQRVRVPLNPTQWIYQSILSHDVDLYTILRSLFRTQSIEDPIQSDHDPSILVGMCSDANNAENTFHVGMTICAHGLDTQLDRETMAGRILDTAAQLRPSAPLIRLLGQARRQSRAPVTPVGRRDTELFVATYNIYGSRATDMWPAGEGDLIDVYTQLIRLDANTDPSNDLSATRPLAHSYKELFDRIRHLRRYSHDEIAQNHGGWFRWCGIHRGFILAWLHQTGRLSRISILQQGGKLLYAAATQRTGFMSVDAMSDLLDTFSFTKGDIHSVIPQLFQWSVHLVAQRKDDINPYNVLRALRWLRWTADDNTPECIPDLEQKNVLRALRWFRWTVDDITPACIPDLEQIARCHPIIVVCLVYAIGLPPETISMMRREACPASNAIFDAAENGPPEIPVLYDS